MVIFDQFLSKNTLNLDKKLLKKTTVCPKYAPWRSNQEWHSICADTVFSVPIIFKSTIAAAHLPRQNDFFTWAKFDLHTV